MLLLLGRIQDSIVLWQEITRPEFTGNPLNEIQQSTINLSEYRGYVDAWWVGEGKDHEEWPLGRRDGLICRLDACVFPGVSPQTYCPHCVGYAIPLVDYSYPTPVYVVHRCSQDFVSTNQLNAE